ncbi:MAG: polyprenyl synthetase family protein, partial [Chloroflexota bacterium]
APAVRNIAAFCGKCGIAFQLQDDILGIVGDESKLGKPVGSDIREGKRTTITLKAFREAGPAQRDRLKGILGNPKATNDDINVAANLLRELGGIEYTQNLARGYLDEALPLLAPLPQSEYKDLLLQWAEYLVERKF